MTGTQIAKSNLATRFLRGVVTPLVQAADWMSWMLFIIFLFILFGYVGFALDIVQIAGNQNFYEQNFWWILYMSWVLMVLSTINPLIHIQHEKKEVPIGLLVSISVFHLLSLLVISALVLIKKYPAQPAVLTALIGSAAAAAMAGVGWYVQFLSSAKTQRRAHTFNVLMQSRLSKEFQEQVRSRDRHFPPEYKINAVEAELCSKEGLQLQIKAIQKKYKRRIKASPDKKQALEEVKSKQIAELEDKYSSIQGIKYLLNFYEFLCAGIRSGDLDGELLFQTLSGIGVGLYTDTEHYRAAVKARQTNAFEHMDTVIGAGWCRKTGVGPARVRVR
jgi:hypothetical protein